MKGFEFEKIPSIAELNRDVESFVIQASGQRTRFFNDSYKVLQFVHFSDIHASSELWERLMDYIDTYEDYFHFALHTGDYCEDSQDVYVNLYNQRLPQNVPVYNCVGNHDTHRLDRVRQPKRTAHKLLFSHAADWNVCFQDIDASMTYYRDFPESGIRLIVLDCYYGGSQQAQWLEQRLKEAAAKGIHVITAAHEMTSSITHKLDVTFQTLDDFERLGGNRVHHLDIEEIILRFQSEGGVHICHLAGHEHSDMIGYTDNGILNVIVECATNWDGWSDSRRLRGFRCYDCCNVVSIDVNQTLLKLVRVGDNADHYLRRKRVLCYDYLHKKIICND